MMGDLMAIFWSLIMAMGILLFNPPGSPGAEAVKLPPPGKMGGMPLAQALEVRRTVRRFAARPLEFRQISQLLWSADGVSDLRGFRTSPSAGGTYPLDLYLVVGEKGVRDLPAGVYHYQVEAHALALLAPGDARAAVARAALHQDWMAQAPVMVAITGQYRRCSARYGDRGVRYTHMEAGNVSQNLSLAAEGLGLGSGIVGAFEDRALAQVLKLPQGHEPLLVIPVGYKY
jgi:SagB-type dehydrogenase family enzyme